MTYSKLWLVGLILLTHIVYLFPAPALGMEKVWRNWQRDQQRQQQQQRNTQENRHQYNEPGIQETHAAATEEACRDMARRFKREGRNVQLVQVLTGKGTLPYTCVFAGSDAQTGYFDEKRY